MHTLIFCGPESQQFGYLKCVLLCFEVVSGLKINLSKTEMVPIGEDPDIDTLAAILGCKVSALPMKYLRLPSGARFKSKAIWDSNLEKIEKRLARWKKLYLYGRENHSYYKHPFKRTNVFPISICNAS